jgi:hypothetical protein
MIDFGGATGGPGQSGGAPIGISLTTLCMCDDHSKRNRGEILLATASARYSSICSGIALDSGSKCLLHSDKRRKSSQEASI